MVLILGNGCTIKLAVPSFEILEKSNFKFKVTKMAFNLDLV